MTKLEEAAQALLEEWDADPCRPLPTMDALRAALAEPAAEREALTEELATCKAELDRERMRLVACGVVARANTPESAANARSMDNDYRSASCEDVADAVDEQMRLRAELARAMRVVNAAKTYKNDDSHDDTRSLNLLLDAVEKWESGQ